MKKNRSKSSKSYDQNKFNQQLQKIENVLKSVDSSPLKRDSGTVKSQEPFSSVRDFSYSYIFESMHESALILSADFRVIYCNHSFLELIKQPHNRVIGAIFIQYIHRKDRAYFGELLTKASHENCRGEIALEVAKDCVKFVYFSINKITINGEMHYLIFAADITECKLAEQALRKSEEEFRTMFESSASMMVLVEPVSGIIYRANAAACTIFGYSHRELIDKKLSELITISNEESFPEGDLNKLSSRKYFTFEYCQPTGEVGFFEFYGNLFTLGKKELYFGIIHNITDRKHMEAVMDQLMLEVGERVKELDTLYGLSAIMGKPDTQLDDVIQQIINFLPAAWEEFNEFCGRLRLNGYVYQTDNFRETNFRKEFTINTSGYPIGVLELFYLGNSPELWKTRHQGGERDLIQVIIHRLGEVIGRVKAEQALRMSEKQYRLLFENADLGILIIEAEGEHAGQIVQANVAATEMYGYPVEVLIKKSINDINSPANAADFQKKLPQILKGKWIDGETTHSRKDGTEFPAEDHSGLLDLDGHRYILNFSRDITMRKLMENAVLESEKRFRLLADTAPVMIWMSGQHGERIYFNKIWLNFTGRTPEKDLGYGWKEGIHPDDVDRCEAMYQTITQEKASYTLDYRLKRFDGEYRYILETGAPRFSSDSSFVGYVGSCIDLTERKKMEEALRRSEERYRTVVENQGEGTLYANVDEHIEYANPAADGIFGEERGKLVGKNLREFMTKEQFGIVRKQTKLRKQGMKNSYEIEICRKDGQKRTILITANPQFNDQGRYVGSFGIFRDITERKQVEDYFKYIATHDQLTGLANRADFYTHLGQAITRAGHEDSTFAVFYLDLDGFKNVNDIYGHEQGDILLKLIATRLQNAIGKGNIVARLGGDEFCFIIHGVDQEKKIARVANRILKTISTPIEIVGESYNLTGSIGISIFPQNGEQPEQLIKNADKAMYQAKVSGKNRIMFFSN